MSIPLDDPTAVALTIFRALSARRIEAALYGGLALAAYGEPRETGDADGHGAPRARPPARPGARRHRGRQAGRGDPRPRCRRSPRSATRSGLTMVAWSMRP